MYFLCRKDIGNKSLIEEREMSIQRKLIIALCLIVGINTLAFYAVYYKVRIAQNNYISKLEGKLEAFERSDKLLKNIIQIQQFLTDISATRALDGLDDGKEKAKEYYSSAIEEIEYLKSYTGEVKKFENIRIKLDSYFKMGNKMADMYIKFGPKKANKLMASFDETAVSLSDELFPVVKKIKSGFTESLVEVNKRVDFVRFVTYYLPMGLVVCVFLGGYFFFRFLNREFEEISAKLNRVSDFLKDQSVDLNIVSSDLEKSANGQYEKIQQTVSAMDEISHMANETRDNTASVMNLSQETTTATERGKSTVREMVQAIEQITESNEKMIHEVKNGNTEIGHIVDLISEIGEKTAIINDIVFQTKLLSFNASVEAARAGEHGKGFAVVAEEVGNLADMSGKASSEINSMLEIGTAKVKGIVEHIRKGVDLMAEENRKKVQAGIDKASACEKELSSIGQNVSNVHKSIKAISTATDEQSTGIVDATQGMRGIDGLAHGNTDLAKNVSFVSDKMTRNIDELVSLDLELKKLSGLLDTEEEGKGSVDTNQPSFELLDDIDDAA